MRFKENPGLLKKLGALALGSAIGATGAYFTISGASDGVATFIKGRADPSLYTNYAQRQENNQWSVGLGGIAAIGGVYLIVSNLKKEKRRT